MIILSTAATVIASQALISGAFSLTSQAIRLGYFPRFTVKHTSAKGEGQIYVPFDEPHPRGFVHYSRADFSNLEQPGRGVWASRDRHHGHYFDRFLHGLQILLALEFGPRLRNHCGVLTLRHSPFLANLLKFFDGGWIPLLAGSGFFVVMALWKIGRSLLARHFADNSPPLDDFWLISRNT